MYNQTLHVWTKTDEHGNQQHFMFSPTNKSVVRMMDRSFSGVSHRWSDIRTLDLFTDDAWVCLYHLINDNRVLEWQITERIY